MNFLSIKRFFALISQLIGVFFVSFFFSSAYAEPAVAQVVWVKGVLNAAAPKAEKPRVLKRGDIVYEHDTLTTSKDSTGQIVFSDSGLLSLKEETVFRIDEYKFNKGQDPSQEKYVASLVKGGLRTITGAISKGHPENYKLETPVATIGVRGTELRVDWSVEGGLAVGVYKGKIVVANQAGSALLDSASSQIYTLIYRSSEAPKPTAKTPPVLRKELPLQEVKPSARLLSALSSEKAAVAPPGGNTRGGANGGGSSSGGASGRGSSGGGATNPDSGDFKICN